MNPARMLYDAIVIGGGHNGLVAAAYLGKAGHHVLVLERREVIGGAAVSEHPWAGWTVSTASYVCSLLHPDIIRDLDLPAHGYEAYLKDPASFNALADGRSLLLWRDPVANEREISRFSKRDVIGMQKCDTLLRSYAGELFAAMNEDDPRFDHLSPQAQEMFVGSAAEFTEKYIETPVLQAAIATDGIIGTFAGPRDPGTGYVLAHHYAGQAMGIQGAWGYVRGGMGAISTAVAGAAQQHGVEIRTNSPVAQVLVRSNRAVGVVLDDGEEIEAHAVLSNADPKTTFRLVPKNVLEKEFLDKVAAWRDRGISMKVNLALGEVPVFTSRPDPTDQSQFTATLHIAPDIDYIQRAYEDAARGLPSQEPFIECYLQSPSDPTLAPKGKHLLSIFAQYFPYERSDGPWTDTLREEAADSVVRTLAKFAPNVPNAIEARQILTPVDIEKRFGISGGHIFHGELLPGQIFEHRFGVRTPLTGLYLCGSGTHPGGCVSGIPGMRGARAVTKDLATAAFH